MLDVKNEYQKKNRMGKETILDDKKGKQVKL